MVPCNKFNALCRMKIIRKDKRGKHIKYKANNNNGETKKTTVEKLPSRKCMKIMINKTNKVDNRNVQHQVINKKVHHGNDGRAHYFASKR